MAMDKIDAEKHLSLEEAAYRRIRSMIVQGELKPGEQIVQESLADQLGVSRTPLRTALARLTRENFLDASPRGGSYVREFAVDELLSIWEIRAVLEGLVCRLLAPTIESKHVAYLRTLITDAARVPDDGRIDWHAYRSAEVEFHGYLSDLVNDNRLSNILDSLQILSISLLAADAQHLSYARSPQDLLPEHLAVLDALEARDAEEAERRMVGHIRSAIEVWRSAGGFQFWHDRLVHAVGDRAASLADRVGETVVLCHRREGEAVVFHQVEAKRAVKASFDLGAAQPLHATAAGKVLLAALPWEEARSLLPELPRPAPTSATVRDAERLAEELEAVQAQGYALDREELEAGLASVAAPIFTPSGVVIATIGVLVPVERFAGADAETFVAPTLETAEAIARRLAAVHESGEEA